LENRVSLFIPVYNAASLLKDDLTKLYLSLLTLRDCLQIVIVDDNVKEVSESFRHVIEKVKTETGREIEYISYDKGPSRRENLAKSFQLAKYEIIGFMDADFSCDASYFLKAVELLKEKSADIIIGSRYVKGARVSRRLIRRIFSFFYNTAIRMIFKSEIKDHQCGLKVFKKSIVTPILEKMGYDEKFIRGWFWDAEFLIRAAREDLKIIEMPVDWCYADSSTFNILRELRCLGAIAKLRKELD